MLRQEPSPSLTTWKLDSLYLTEQEWIEKALSNQTIFLGEKPLNNNFQALIEHPTSFNTDLFSSLPLKKNTAWDNLWNNEFSAPSSRFFFNSFKEELKSLNVGFQLLEKDKLTQGPPLSKFIHFSSCEDYWSLLDHEQLKIDLQREISRREKEFVLTHVIEKNLLEECEILSKRVSELFSEKFPLEEALLSEEVIFPTIEEVYRPEQQVPVEEPFVEPLFNSLPSLFLYWYFSSEAFKSERENNLKPIPDWIKKLSKLFYRWSILKHMTQEQIDNIVKKSPDFATAKKYIQWHDPQEKWFYFNLPAINLFFDRFRESIKHNFPPDWEEPESRFSLTEVGLGDELDFSTGDYRRPVFLYEGISPLTIGKELQNISKLLDLYEGIYHEQSKQELEKDPLSLEELASKAKRSLRLLKEFEEEL